jgi:ribosomal protein L11 methyltransferase
MRDYILRIESDDEEAIQARLFLTASSGATVVGDVIEAYFGSAEDRDAAAIALADLNPESVDRERIDWLEHYQQSLTAMEIGERFLVAPDASLLRDPGKLTIIVPQEQAFGTGSHETTALCIETLETIPMGRGLDIGSGSGILAIAMLRLGASKAIAFDNDPDAYGALRDNRLRNGISDDAMPLFIGSVEALRGGTFDVLTMNIIPEVILPLLPEVVTHMAEDARLILSGILVVKCDEVVAAAAAHDLELVAERSKGEWWASVYRLRRNRGARDR